MKTAVETLEISREAAEQTDRENTMYVLVVAALIVYVITESTVIMAILAALGMMYLVPAKHMKRLMGYLIISDTIFSWWLVGVASATLGGLHIAITAGVVYSLLTREFRAIWGSERLAVNGSVKWTSIFAELTSQGGRWTRAVYKGLRHNTKIEPPSPLTFEWVAADAGGGFRATRTYRVGRWLLTSGTSYIYRTITGRDRAMEKALAA